MAIKEEEYARIVIPRPRQSAYPYIAVIAVVDHGEAADGPQYVRQGSVPVLLDLLGRDHGDRGGGIRSLLEKLGSAVNRVHLKLREILDAHLVQLGLLSFLRPGRPGAQNQPREKPARYSAGCEGVRRTAPECQETCNAPPCSAQDSDQPSRGHHHLLVSAGHTFRCFRS